MQGIGIANLSDSLHALKGMVFDQQRMSFDELLAVLKANFATPEGEKVRARLINRFEKYGNDIDDTTSPIEAGLGWITKFTKDFVDSSVLKAQKDNGY